MRGCAPRAWRRCDDRTAEVTIESIAAGGDGVGAHEGVVVFVPRTAPGDRVRVELDRESASRAAR